MTDTPKPPIASDLKTRAIVGVVLIVVALLSLWVGGLAFWLLAVLAGLLMSAEWVDMHKGDARAKRTVQFALSVPLAIMAPIAAGPGFFALGLLAGGAFFVAAVTRRADLARGIVYVGLPVLALVFLRDRPDGLLLCFWALALVWACDIGAYFAGRTIGGPKLAPRISPNKTWAGLLGGVAAATIFGGVMHGQGLPFLLAMATPLLAVLSAGGDLYESWLKRRAGVKDSGTLLPGHGGLLDRLDGVVPVAPVAAALVMIDGAWF